MNDRNRQLARLLAFRGLVVFSVLAASVAVAQEIDIDPDVLSSTLEQGQAETRELTVSNPGTAALDWELSEAESPFERMDAIDLAQDVRDLRAAVIDPDGRFVYLGTDTEPARVVKFDLERFEPAGMIELEAGEDYLQSAVIDPEGRFAYFGTGTEPGRVVKIDLDTFERFGAIELEAGENHLRSAVIDPDGEFTYFGTATVPGRVVKIDLDGFERLNAIELEVGGSLATAVMDPNGQYAYFGTYGWVTRIDLEAFEGAGAVEMPPLIGRDLRSAVIAPDGRFAYFAAVGQPAWVRKIDLDSFTHVDSLSLHEGEVSTAPLTAVIEPTGRFAYFGNNDASPGDAAPAQISEIDLDGFQLGERIVLEDGETPLRIAVVGPTGEDAWFGTEGDPGRVIRVGLRGPDCRARDWLDVDPSAATVPAGQDLPVEVTSDTAGLAPDRHLAALCFVSNDPDRPKSPVLVSLEVTPSLAFDPDAHDFDHVPVGTDAGRVVTLRNHGDEPTGLSFGLDGNDPAAFQADTDACSDTLPAGESCALDIAFAPPETGLFEAALIVEGDGNRRGVLALSGRGVPPPTRTTWTGAVDSNWFEGGNWDIGVPGADLHVTIDTLAPGGQGVLIDGGSAFSRTITLGADVDGAGRLTVENGGSLHSEGMSILGEDFFTSSRVGVSGPGSVWHNVGPLRIGRAGTASLAIDAGGRVESGGDNASASAIGYESDGDGEVLVSGAGTRWLVNGSNLTVGASGGTGLLAIENGGFVSVDGHVSVSAFDEAVGTVAVSGEDALLESGGLIYVGLEGGTGGLTVADGARVSTGGNAHVGMQGGADGQVLVSGDDAEWMIDGYLQVGSNGAAVLTIEQGGTVSLDGNGLIASSGNSNGEVTVSGSGSRWEIGGSLAVAAAGEGVLTVDEGAAVVAGDITIAASAGSAGAVHLFGNGDSRGILETGRISRGEGDGSAFNLDNLYLHFDGGMLRATGDEPDFLHGFSGDNRPRLDAGGAFIDTREFDLGIAADFFSLDSGGLTKLGTGTLTLSGDSAYNGGTVITEGILIATGEQSLGDGAVSVSANTVLGLHVDAAAGGSLEFANDINNQGTLSLESNESGPFRFVTGRISGAGDVIKTGAGGFAMFDPENDYTGDTVIAEGILHGAGGISTVSTVQIESTGILRIDASDENIGALSGGGAVEFIVGGETLSVGGNDTDTTFSGTFGGVPGMSGAHLHKLGSGTLTLTGDSQSYAGTTTVAGGGLIVDGALGGTLAVEGGARLGGTGTVGATGIAQGGALAPGDSIGTLTVAGDLALEQGAVLEFEFGPPGNGDRVVVDGDLASNGALLDVNDIGGLEPGTYLLFEYGGELVDGEPEIGALPDGFPYIASIDTSRPGEVTLRIRPDGPLFVDTDATGEATGTSWEDAFTDLQHALDVAVEGDEIWVAEGEYRPAPPGSSDRGATFRLIDGVAVYGGFNAIEKERDERDWAIHHTILDGSTPGNHHVVTGSGTGDTAVLDGFTVTGGLATGSGTATHGGGIYIDDGAPRLANLVVEGNYAEQLGGGIYITGGSAPALINVVVMDNESAGNGGGIGNADSSPVLVNVTLSGNSASRGGGIHNSGSDNVLALHNTIVWGNDANIGGNEISHLSGNIELHHSLYRDGPGDVTGGGELIIGTETLTDAPLLADPGNDDLRLLPGSPAIFAGSSEPYDAGGAAEGIDTDLAGNPRFVDGMIDIGAWQNPGFDLEIMPDAQSAALGTVYEPVEAVVFARTDTGFEDPETWPLAGGEITVGYPGAGATVTFDGTADNPLVITMDDGGQAATPEPIAAGEAGTFTIDFQLAGADSAPVQMHNLGVYSVTASVAAGDGTITPAQQDVIEGEDATFAVTPGAGWHVTSVTGDTCTPQGQGAGEWIAENIVSDCAAEAAFERIEYSLDLTIVGDGEVQVEPDQETYFFGDTVTLTPQPAPGWLFLGWEGDADGQDDPLVLTIEGDLGIDAVFVPADALHPVPALNRYGLITLVLVIFAVSLRRSSRRKA